MLILQRNFILRNIAGFLMLFTFYMLCTKHLIYLGLLVCFISLGCMFELLSLAFHKKCGFSVPTLLVYCMSISLFYSTALSFFLKKFLPTFWLLNYNYVAFLMYVFCACRFVFYFKKRLLKKQIVTLTISHAAVSISTSVLKCAIKNLHKGKFYLIFPALCVIANDAGAYYVGKIFGKTKLFKFSPNKTVEGFIGGFFSVCILCLLGILKKCIKPNLFCIYVIFISSFIAPFSGFMASVIKRYFKKKDYGSLLPGHGGLMDRFDCHFMCILCVNYFIYK
ncbi:CDS1 [Ecytonucleospora hepatopenaei]|uniref:Phosphatidate cytidylyltransferase n=1 Tax=Ecytonucleospora hepatopenaei TaxID=646526 RepID=A0A1W0E6U4_9MICR|nr:CDS1 [Ecytonucleospora hepatopenaei]